MTGIRRCKKTGVKPEFFSALSKRNIPRHFRRKKVVIPRNQHPAPKRIKNFYGRLNFAPKSLPPNRQPAYLGQAGGDFKPAAPHPAPT